MSATITRVSPADAARSFGVEVYRQAYNRQVNVSQYLEQQDPTADYPQDAPERQLDAFERVLAAAGVLPNGIPAMGIRATTWGDATATAEGRALMVEFCARIWRQTIGTAPTTPMVRQLVKQGFQQSEQRSLLFSGDTALNTILQPYYDDLAPRAKALVPPVPLNRIVARTTAIEGDAYRSLYITDDFGTDAYRMKRVAEGAEIPSTTLVTGEHTLRVHKFGRAIRSTYEQLRRQRLDRIAWIVARMAMQAEVDKVGMVINVIVSGDGNANTAATVLTLTGLDAAASAGTLTLKGWLTFKNRFIAGYNLDVILAQEATMMQLIMLPINTVNGMPLAMVAPGAFGGIRPIQNLLAGGVEYGITADAPALKIIGLDSSQAVERVTEIGGQVSEVERFINNQTTLMTMTEVEGYGMLDVFGAAKIFNLNA